MQTDINFDTYLHQFRHQISHSSRDICYLNHAAQSPLPRDTVQAVNNHLNDRHDGSIMTFHRDLEIINQCRNRIRDLINAPETDQIAFIGNVPADVEGCGIDAFATGGHKWLMAPAGIGFLYLSERLCKSLKTPDPGWMSVEDPWALYPYNQPLRSDARRYEGGMLNIPGIYGLNASIALLLNTGIERIFEQAITCNRRLREGLENISLQPYGSTRRKRRSGILAFQLPEQIDPATLEQDFSNRNIYLSVRDNKLRFSPHGYNTLDEIDYAITETEALYSSLI